MGTLALVAAVAAFPPGGAFASVTAPQGSGRQVAELTAPDGVAGDTFGTATTIDANGTTAVVGTFQRNGSTGAAYVFTTDGSTWTETAELTASDGQTSDNFSVRLAIDAAGDTIVVGAGGHNRSQGAAYVFTRKGSTWTQTAELTPPPGTVFSEFGISVAIDALGDTIVIGANGQDDATGAAYVYTANGLTWTRTARLTATDGAPGHYFGEYSAIEPGGRLIVVGASGALGGTYPGAAYVFTKAGSAWTQVAELTASDGVASDLFGFAVGIGADGGTILVGAPTHTRSSSSNFGAVYVFTRLGATWTQTDELAPAPGGPSSDWFGFSISVGAGGGTALIGVWEQVAGSTGAAYVFSNDGSSWRQAGRLTPADGQAGDRFGFAVAVSTEAATGVVGAYGRNAYVGAADVFTGLAGGEP